MSANSPACSKCGERAIRTIESHQQLSHTRRRKRCKACGHSYTTYEVSAERFDKLIHAEEVLARIGSFFNSANTSNNSSKIITCDLCIHMSPRNGCTMGFPEAGGDFATECSFYEDSAG